MMIRVTFLVVLLMFVLSAVVASPISDIRSDIKGTVDDTKTSIQTSIDHAKQATKEIIVTLFQIASVVLVGWLFTFLVDHHMAKLMRLLLVVVGVAQVVKCVLQWLQ